MKYACLAILALSVCCGGCAQTSPQRQMSDIQVPNVEAASSRRNRQSVVVERPQAEQPVTISSDGEQPGVKQVSLQIDKDAVGSPTEAAGSMSASLDSLESMALASNPTLIELQAKVDAASGRWLQVGLKPNPNFGMSAQEVGNEGRGGQLGAFFGQEIVRGNKLGLSQQAAAWDVNRAEIELQAQRLRVLNDVRGGFYRTLVAQKRIEVARELRDIAHEGVEKAKLLIQTQEPRSVLTQAEIEEELASMLVENMVVQRKAQWRRLAAVLGRADLPVEDLDGNLAVSATELVWDEALERIRNESPETAAAQAKVEELRWTLQRACAEAIPNVTVQAGVFYDEGSGDPFASLQLSMPIPIRNWNQGGVAEARANMTAASNRVHRTQLKLQERLAAVFQTYEQARQRASRYDTTILKKAKENLDLNKQAYEAGDSSYLAILTAQRSYSQAQLARLNAVEQLWLATIQIEGMLLNESLAQD